MLEVGPLQIVPDEHLARAEGRALMLSIRELRLLTELARRADRIVTREELFRLVWGREMRVRDRSVDVYVRKLRAKPGARRCRTGRSSTPTSVSGTGWQLTAASWRRSVHISINTSTVMAPRLRPT